MNEDAVSTTTNEDVEIATSPGGIRRRDRLLLVVGSMLIFFLFGVAARLTPSQNGLGTHRQLGLPPCGFRVVLGIPCPTCGFTTTWSHVMHGNFMAAAKTNLGGLLLWFFAAISAVWMLVSGCRGKWFLGVPNPQAWGIVLAPVLLVTFSIWIMRIFFV